ncbi:MAG: tetratricopeptide repeat protein, partial [Planctomycetota bacterium]
ALQLNEEGIRLVSRGEYEKAIKTFTKARRLQPADVTLKQNLATARSRHAGALLGAGKDAEAIQQFRLAVALVPTEAVHHANLGIALVRFGKVAEGKKSLEAAVRADAACVAAHAELGSLHYREGDLFRAKDHLGKAAKAKPKSADLKKAYERVAREYEVEKKFKSVESDHFRISWDGAQDATVGDRLKIHLEDAYSEVAADLGIRPERKTRVILYTRQNFKAVTGAHDWVGGLFDGRIRIPVQNFHKAEREIRSTIRHEYVHVAVDSVTKKCPAWLNEGLAQHYEGRSVSTWLGTLSKAKRADILFSLKELTPNFTAFKDANRARLAYAQSLSIVSFLMDEHGPKAIGTFLTALGEGKKPEEACRAAFTMSQAELYEDWAETL